MQNQNVFYTCFLETFTDFVTNLHDRSAEAYHVQGRQIRGRGHGAIARPPPQDLGRNTSKVNLPLYKALDHYLPLPPDFQTFLQPCKSCRLLNICLKIQYSNFVITELANKNKKK